MPRVRRAREPDDMRKSMRRWMLALAAALSLLLCAATIAIWVRSYFIQDLFIHAWSAYDARVVGVGSPRGSHRIFSLRRRDWNDNLLRGVLDIHFESATGDRLGQLETLDPPHILTAAEIHSRVRWAEICQTTWMDRMRFGGMGAVEDHPKTGPGPAVVFRYHFAGPAPPSSQSFWTRQIPSYHREQEIGWCWQIDTLDLRIPCWLPALLTVLLPIQALRVRHRERKRRRNLRSGRCPSCGYDLRATPAFCPECGAVPSAAQS
jgi:hypothetical protein